MKDFFNYCKSPYYIEESSKINWNLFLKLYVIYFFLSLIVTGLISLLRVFINIQNKIYDYSNLQLVLLGVILAPLLEEILFRLLLKSNKLNFVIYWIINVSLIIVLFIFERTDSLIILLTIFIIVQVIFLLNYILKGKIFKRENFKYAFYASVIIFGIIHFNNIKDIELIHFIIAPILILSQLFSGFILGYIRMVFGIKYSMLFHFFMNVFLLLSLLNH